jgi:RNA-directed DNA polymerase
MSSLYRKLCDESHLTAAWKALRKSNSRSRGIDDVTIEQFRASLGTEIALISKQLRERSYTFQRYRGTTIPKPGSDKPRPIQIPAVRDRVVMKALALMIAPKLKKYDYSCSFAYIENRSIHTAVARVHELAAQGNTFILEADITNFFGAVDQEKLLKKLHGILGAKSLKMILNSAIQNEIGNRDQFQPKFRELFPASTSGIPQGGVLSPMLANLYLSKFDKACIARGLNLVRYADDFVVMCKSEDEARTARKFCESFLGKRLGLELAATKTRIVDYRGGFDFLGFRIEGGKHAPSQKSVKKLKAKISSLVSPLSGKALFPILVELRNVLNGWYEAYRRSDLQKYPIEINAHVTAEVTTYLKANDFLMPNQSLKSKQVKMLGIPKMPIVEIKLRS